MKFGEVVRYGISGLTARAGAKIVCPSCGSEEANRIDRKFFHSFLECRICNLRYRFPGQSETEASILYQKNYSQEGLTTDLPSDEQLTQLVESKFIGSEKDFSHIIGIVSALSFEEGSRILDFGANWGYGAYQFNLAGFNAEAYEVSYARAKFGKKIGIQVRTDLSDISDEFDVVYSGHVLEHISNPRQALETQLSLVRPGGVVIGHTPNGSADRQNTDPRAFRSNWGYVHPVLLSERFVAQVAGRAPYFITSSGNEAELAHWDKTTQHIGKMTGGELFFAIVKS